MSNLLEILTDDSCLTFKCVTFDFPKGAGADRFRYFSDIQDGALVQFCIPNAPRKFCTSFDVLSSWTKIFTVIASVAKQSQGLGLLHFASLHSQ